MPTQTILLAAYVLVGIILFFLFCSRLRVRAAKEVEMWGQPSESIPQGIGKYFFYAIGVIVSAVAWLPIMVFALVLSDSVGGWQKA